MTREYTIGEACDELRCGRKTLSEWLEDEGITSNDLPKGEVDKRSRLLSRTLLMTLSKKHKRPLTSELEASGMTSGDGGLLSLLKEVGILRREAEERNLREEEREELLRQQIQYAVEQNLSTRLTQITELEPPKDNEVADLKQRIQRLEKNLRDMDATLSDLMLKIQHQQTAPVLSVPHPLISRASGEDKPSTEAHPEIKAPTPSPRPNAKRRYERPSNRKDLSPSTQDQRIWSEAELFNENWFEEGEGRLVSRWWMSKAHGIPDANLYRDIKRGWITILERNIKVKGIWRKGAFTAAQRRRVWEEYHELSWFTPCEICLRNEHTVEE